MPDSCKMYLLFSILPGFPPSLTGRYHHCAGNIPGNIRGGGRHVCDPVNSGYKTDSGQRQPHGLQYHRQHNHGRTGNPCRTDGGKGTGKHDRDLLTQIQIQPEHICNKDRADSLIDCCSIHVDGRSQRQDKGGYLRRNVQILRRLHRIRQSG